MDRIPLLKRISYFKSPQIRYERIEPHIKDVVDSGVHTKGSYRDNLEFALQDYLGVDGVVSTSSGMSALWIAMRVMHDMNGCKRMSVPAFTWTPVVEAVVAAGYTACCNDIDPDTWLPVMQDGGYDSYLALDTFGSIDINEYPDNTVYDAAHSLGVKGVGSRGVAECFSMAATKPVSAGGEGGFITTNDRYFARQCSALRDMFARITEIQCAIALEHLSHLDEMIIGKRAIAAYYRKRLPYQFQEIPHDSTHSKICFLCDNSGELIARAAAAGVECRKYYEPLADLSVSRSVYDRIVCLPAWVGVDVEGVVRALQ